MGAAGTLFKIAIWTVFWPILIPLKFGVLMIKIDLFITYSIIRIFFIMPIQLVFRLISKPFSVGFHVIEQMFMDVERNPRKYGFLVGIPALLLLLFVFPISANNPGVTVISLLASIGLPMAFFTGFRVFKAIITGRGLVAAGAASTTFIDPDGNIRRAGESAMGAAASAASNENVRKGAKRAGQVAADLGREGNLDSVSNFSKGALLGDLEKMAARLVEEDLPFLRGIVTTQSGGLATGAAADAAGAAATTVTASLSTLIPVLAVALLLFVVQLVFFWAVIAAFGAVIIPLLIKPLLTMLGFASEGADLGAQYGNWVGQTVGNKYFAGLGSEFGEVGAAYTQAKARVFCLLQGPACLRQWQLNNTQRPGSRDVGETYGLKIDRFEVGQGKSLDVAYNDPDYAIPISFTISNPRHGLKGINAKNLAFRLQVIDTNRGVNNPYCDTGWITEVEAYTIDDKGQDNDIYPGTSASTGYMTVSDSAKGATSPGSYTDSEGNTVKGDDFSLRGCEMLQPALGSQKTILLKVRYEYSSQATLYFDAMSLQTLQSDSSISKSWEESKTADTPVQAAINVNAPVLFNEDTLEPQPFAVRATLNTDKSDIDYKVTGMNIKNSRQIERTSDGVCQFEGVTPGATIGLTEDAKKNMIAGSDPDRDSESYWFNRDRKPPIFGCVMQLSDPGAISPTGETLTMGIDANYTVAKSDRLQSFKVFNGQCSRFNCPLIVPLSDNASVTDYNFQSICSGIDAGNGCSIIRGSLSDDFLIVNSGEIMNSKYDSRIDSNEVAIRVEDVVRGDLPNVGYSDAVGLDLNTWERYDTNTDGVLENNRGNMSIISYTDRENRKESEIVEFDDGDCKEYPDGSAGRREPEMQVIYNGCNYRTVS